MNPPITSSTAAKAAATNLMAAWTFVHEADVTMTLQEADIKFDRAS